MKKLLVGCEFSGRVRESFKAKGYDAYSCDLLDTEIPGQHIQDDITSVIKSEWFKSVDTFIAHPPCTRICNSGVLRLYVNGKKENGIDPVKWVEMEAAANFFKLLLDAGRTKKTALENPIPHKYALEIIGEKYKQIIQPYNFNEDASKATCLWLNGLPLLLKTGYFPPRLVDGKPRWGNQCDSGQNKLGKGKGLLRAKTYWGIAQAMADQWS